MIVYNITINIEPEIEKEWLDWQKQEHIPEVMASGKFSDYKFYRLTGQAAHAELTFVIQYFAPGWKEYNDYIELYAPKLREKALKRWGDRFIAFRTVMEEVE